MKMTALMQKALDGAWLRQEVLAENVANSETPGYKRQDVDFRTALAKAVEPRMTLLTTSERHVDSRGSQGIRVTQDEGRITPDGNGVDMDREMAEVSANAMYYAAVSRQLSGYLSLIRRAVTEGRR